jgi:hypothetical protein
MLQNPKIGGMTIDLPKALYFPGEELKGNIWLKTSQDLEVYCLELKLQMQENWSFTPERETITESNNQILIDLSIDINNSLKHSDDLTILPKGEYTFPFTFIIPDYLSPSFEFIGMNQDYIHIRYMFYTCLLSNQGEKYCLSNINYLILRSLPKLLSSSLTYSSCIDVHSWILFPQGTTVLNVSYDKNTFSFDEYLKIKCHVDNSRCKLNIKHLKITLTQKIIFKDINGNGNGRNYYGNEFQAVKLNINCKAGQIVEDLIIQLPLDNTKINTHLYQQKNLNSNSKQKIPYYYMIKNHKEIFKFQPSVNSTLITCEYEIKVSLHYDSVVNYANRPRVFMPFSLTHKIESNAESFEFSDVVRECNNTIMLNNNSNSNSNSNSNYNFSYQDVNQYEDINSYQDYTDPRSAYYPNLRLLQQGQK